MVALGTVEADDEEVLLEVEPMLEVSGQDWEADSQNFSAEPSKGSGIKLILISSMLELEEPAECTLSTLAVSPLLKQGLHLRRSQDLEWELPLVLSSVLGAWQSL